jgi:spore coat polysaccharide biosynthesis protein SpsF
MNIVAIVQARVSSVRLAGKILKPVGGKTVLGHVVDRLNQSELIDQVIVATTLDSVDDILVDWCKERKIEYFRGDRENVLIRFYECAKEYMADVIVRVTSDNPLVDPSIVDQTIRQFMISKADYAANNLEKTFPHGLDVEVISFKALSISWQEAHIIADLEHVTQYVRHRPKRFHLVNISAPENHHYIRITVDEVSDFELVSEVFRLLGDNANYENIINLFRQYPELLKINYDAKESHAEYNRSLNII